MKGNKYKIIVLVVILLIVIGLAFRMLANPYRVSGDCMEPTIMDGQLCFVNSLSPYLRKYRINDIVVFKHEGKVWVSRVVALEGDMIKFIEGGVVVNEAILQDVEIHRNWSNWKHGSYAIDETLQVPLAHVYVLSDNLSAQHDDSRVFGPVARESIIGVVW